MDGRFVIDSLIRTSGAQKALGKLKEEARTTAREIESTGKKLAELRGNTKLKQSLDEATAAARQTEQQLDAVNAKLESGTAGRDTARLIAESDRLAAVLRKEDAAVQKTSTAYNAHQQQITALEAKLSTLTGQLAEEEGEVKRNEEAFRRLAALSRFGDALAQGAKRGAAALGKLLQRANPLPRMLGAAGRMAHYLAARIKRLAFGALIFNGVSAALRSMGSWFQRAVSHSGELSGALARLKGAAATAAAPLLQALTPALTALANAATVAFGYLARLVSFFTGKSVSNMKQTAKAITGVGSAAGKASKSLAAFDEVNRLDESDSSSGADAGSIQPDFDFELEGNPFLDSLLAAIEAGDWAGAGSLLADKVNEMVANFDAAAFGAKLGQAIQNGIDFGVAFLYGIDWDAIGQQLAILLNAALEQIDGYSLGQLLVGPVTAALGFLSGFVGELDWGQLGATISGAFCGALDSIAQALIDFDWAGLFTGICDFLQGLDWVAIFESLMGVITAALSGLLDGLLAVADWLEVNYGPAGDFIVILASFAAALAVVNTAATLWDVACGAATVGTNLFGAAFLFLNSSMGPIAIAVGALIAVIVLLATHWEDVKAVALSVWEGIKKVWGSVCDWFGEKILDPLSAAWQAFAGVFMSLWDGITGGLKGAINAVIGFINGMMSAIANGVNAVIGVLNKLSFDVPDWVPVIGGSTFGFNLPTVTAPQIPYLAQGAVIPANREFLAVLGDQKQGTNVEAPLETIKQALAEVLAGFSGGETVIRFEGDLAQLGRVLQPVIEKEGRRRGPSLAQEVFA